MILCKQGAEENEEKTKHKWIKIPYLQIKQLHTKSILHFLEYKHSYNKQKQKSLTGIDHSLLLCVDIFTSTQSHCSVSLTCSHGKSLSPLSLSRHFIALILTGTNSPANYLTLCSQDRLHSPSLIIPLSILPRVYLHKMQIESMSPTSVHITLLRMWSPREYWGLCFM